MQRKIHRQCKLIKNFLKQFLKVKGCAWCKLIRRQVYIVFLNNRQREKGNTSIWHLAGPRVKSAFPGQEECKFTMSYTRNWTIKGPLFFQVRNSTTALLSYPGQYNSNYINGQIHKLINVHISMHDMLGISARLIYIYMYFRSMHQYQNLLIPVIIKHLPLSFSINILNGAQ